MPKGRVSPFLTDCRSCFGPMISRHPLGRYCSPACKAVGQRLAIRKYGMFNRHKIRLSQRRRYDVNPEAVKVRVKAYRSTPDGKAVRAKQSGSADPEKIYARNEVNKAKKRGELKPQPCEKCGAVKTQAHHDDYSRPLDIHWLCTTCHGLEHRKPRN